MEKNVIAKFKSFLTNNGLRQLFEGCLKTYGYGRKLDEYLQDLDDPIMAIAQAFEFDKLNTGCIDFKKESKKWEMECIRKRFDKKINAIVSAYGEAEAIKAIEQYKQEGRFFLYSVDYYKQNAVKAHLVRMKPNEEVKAKKEFTPATTVTDDFEFVKFKRTSKSSDLDDYQIALRYANKNYYVKFNEHISLLARKNGLDQFRLRLDKHTGDVHIFIQKIETDDSIKCNHKSNADTSPLYLCNKAVVEWLMNRYRLEGENNILSVTKNLSHNDNFITIKINGK